MTKLSTQIITRTGKVKIITVEIEDELAAWLVTQTEIVYHDFLLSEYKAKCVERKETRRTQSLDKSLENGFDIADESVDVEQELLQKSENERLYVALRKLTDKQRRVVLLKIVEELSFREISRQMGLNKDTVIEHFNAALKKIKKNF